MNIKELVHGIMQGEINPYHDLTNQYDISRDTVRRRLKDLGLKWDYRNEVLEGELKEEFAEMDADELFKKEKQSGASKSKQKRAIASIINNTQIDAQMHSSANAHESKEKQVDVFDMLLQPQASTKQKRVSRSFYFDHDVLEVLDNMKSGNKSDFVNEAIRHVLRMKGIIE